MAANRRRLSFTRVLALLLVLAGLAAVSWSQATRAYQRITATSSSTWFAPYVDVTLEPTFHFEDPVASPAPNHVLAFVVADRRQPCTPTWGTYYDLDGAGRALDLDRRITRLRQRGGDVVISFGGAASDELATTCTDRSALVDAYGAVVDRYQATTLDFDVEGAALADRAANARRAAALRALQRRAGAAKRPLNVWLTLPVAPSGMPPEAVDLVDATLQAGVSLAGVNVMIMNYGAARSSGDSMRAANEKALYAAREQLAAAYRRTGRVLTDRELWARMGATPMIGRNDVETDRFTLGDAGALVGLARRVRLGRVSMWSANRDDRCGVSTDADSVSNTCSGIAQKPLSFTWELGRLDGPLPHSVRPPASAAATRGVSRDDPATSPHPIWRSEKAYKRGEKVVWHGSVYEAKWWTLGDLPDASAKRLWDTPWRHLGPVLPTDQPSAPERVPGQYRRWTDDQVYLKGDRVRHKGYTFESKWWTQGDEPVRDPDRPDDVPWKPIGKAAPDVGRVEARYPAWAVRVAYLPGARVAHRGYAYEAKWWTKGSRPSPSPEQPAGAPWKLVGKLGS
jgi:chitinase